MCRIRSTIAKPVATAKTEAIVVVDPYSSGKLLIEELLASNVFIIAVQSSRLLSDCWLRQFEPDKYDAYIEHEDIESTVKFIQSVGVKVHAIFAGSEPGVLVAEELQTYFPVPSNVEDHTGMRRHKHAMHERLRQVGIRGIAEICTADVEEALEWIRAHTTFPVIVKPPMSGGSDGLHFCQTEEDVRMAYALECQKLNVNGSINFQLLVQEFIDGPEYVVDCVSNGYGRHLVIGICRYKKIRDPVTRGITYDYTHFLDSRGTEQEQLRAYVLKVLDALGVRFGPSHTEIIIDSRGPCLVETGARMHGGLGPKCLEFATNVPPQILMVDIALNGARLFDELYEQYYYILKSHVLCVDLLNFKSEGRLARPIDDELQKFGSVKVWEVISPGSTLMLTRDLTTSPGSLVMAHPDRAVIWSEYRDIRQLEDTILYETL